MLNEVYINQIIEKGYVEKFKKGKCGYKSTSDGNML